MNNKNSSDLPDEVYIPFVESLYANRWVTYFGVVTQTLVAYVIGRETGHGEVFGFCWAFLAIGALRSADFNFYVRKYRRANAIRHPKRWETRYSIGATLAAALIGTLVSYSIYLEDSFSEFASMTLAMGAMVTVVGKNFASKRLVKLITAAVFLPIFVGLIWVGGLPNWTGCILIVPFVVSVVSMSGGLSDFLGQAVRNRLDANRLAEKLDVALNNMPQGLIMFDRDNKAAVVNRRAVEMLKAPSAKALSGRRLDVILRFARFNGVLGGPANEHIGQRIENILAGMDTRKFLLRAKDGGSVEFSGGRAGADGGVLIFEDVSERIKAEDKISRMARFDTLSGLPNRTYFKELARSLAAASRPDSWSCFFVIDIDDFKHVNDSLGHPVGDELLCRFADRINHMAAENACFSRFGGDEFVGLQTGFHSAEDAEFQARRALASLVGNYDIAGHQLAVTVSAGIVVVPSKGIEMAQVLIKADLALYESKARGKGIFTLFADSMDERYQQRQRLKADLKSAIRDKKLKVFYQPIIDANSMRIATCEALCRWDHPELGPVSPAVFIPLAEETGAISDLTRFMLEQASEDCKGWGGDISVAVNLSAMDFRGAQVADMVRTALARSRLEPHRLEVEVTEGAILEDQQVASSLLSELKRAGVRIALDDFGTGYSSLSYLHNLPLDKVKIDQSFVREIVTNKRSLKLVSGVTQLAHELGLIVTVEGIETLEQFEQLKSKAHIDLAQGFLFGAALSSNGIATLIANTIGMYSRARETDRQVA